VSSTGKRTLKMTFEQVEPTPQQAERVKDGLRLVLELAARRYRRILRETESAARGQKGLD
jgi:hypothetical protein